MKKIFLNLLLLHLCFWSKVIQDETESSKSEIDSGDSGPSSKTPIAMNNKFCSKHCAAGTSMCTKAGNNVNCCGDGIIQSGEQCDWGSFEQLCNKECKLDNAKTCGNDIVDPGEVCQGLFNCCNCYKPAKFWSCQNPIQCQLHCTSTGMKMSLTETQITFAGITLTLDVYMAITAILDYNKPQLTENNVLIRQQGIVFVFLFELNFIDMLTRYGYYDAQGQLRIPLKYPANSNMAGINQIVNKIVPAYNKKKTCFKIDFTPA